MKHRKLLAAIMAVSFCFTMAGCGSTPADPEKELENKLESMSEEDIEKEFEQAANELEQMEAEQSASETEPPVPEIVYEPTNEIKNADFSSGLIQIGNDVFRNGGYYTVEQVVQEFGDRYDVSEINLDGYQRINEENRYTIYSKEDPDLTVDIVANEIIENTEDETETKCRIGDCKVTYFAGSLTKPVWYPKGISYQDDSFTCDSLPALFEENGYPKATKDEADPYFKKYGMYWDDYSGKENYMLRALATEKNLYGCYPVYEYTFPYDLESTKLGVISCNLYLTSFFYESSELLTKYS